MINLKNYIEESLDQNIITEFKDDKILVWIDDIRDPNEPKWKNWIKRNSPIPDPDDIHWVKSYNEFVNWVEKFGRPNCICFDHDLGDIGDHQEKTGYDCAKYMVEWCMDNVVKFPEYAIQSDNTPGRENISKYIENFKKHFRYK